MRLNIAAAHRIIAAAIAPRTMTLALYASHVAQTA